MSLAAYLTGPHTIEYRQIKEPPLKKNHVIINVSSVGICGGDMRFYSGNAELPNPVIRGHEFGGIVKEVDDKALSNCSKKNLRRGKKVVVNPGIFCGKCYYCNHNAENLCENLQVYGGAIDGGMHEEIMIPLENVIVLPDETNTDYIPFIEPTAFAYHVVKGIQESTVVIIGLGAIGLLEQQLCSLSDNEIITIDKAASAIRKSSALGASLSLPADHDDLTGEIKRFLGERKIDVVIDNVCSDSTIDFACKLLKKNGNLLLVGMPHKDLVLSKSIIFTEMTIATNFLYTNADFLTGVELFLSEKMEYKPLLSALFPLSKTEEAFEYKLNNETTKVIIVTDGREEIYV